ncbi:MAG: sulfatase [Planctomycetota bacterium]
MNWQQHRKHFVPLAIALLFLGVGSVCASDTTNPQRPNILWVTSEDNSYHWIGCYGNEDATTPNIDQLASEGIRYKYAYSNAAVCAVARNTLILGRYACSSGTHNMRSRYPVPDGFRTYPSFLRDAGYYCVNRSKTDYNFKTDDKSHWDECGSKAHWKNRDEDQPFFAVFNTTISHESCLFKNKTDGYRERGVLPAVPTRDPASVKLPPHYPDTPEIRQDWVTYMDVVTAMDKQIGEWLKELDDEGVRDNTIVFYYSDHGGILPRAKRYINDTGTHVPMIVSFPEKWQHLAPAEAGTVNDRPVAFIDLPPTVFSLAGVEIPEQFHGRAFAGESAEPAETYSFLYGQRFDSRMLRFVRGVTDGEYRYVRNFHPHRHRGIYTGYPHGQVGWQSLLRLKKAGKLNEVQTAYWTIPQPTEELYHTAADPWELKNLASDPDQQDRLNRMRQATLDKMLEIRDTGIVPESMYTKISSNGTVFDYVQSEDFPYEEVLDVALAVADGGKGITQTLRNAMKHEHPVIRYWGATGCTIQSQEASKLKRLLGKLLDDESETVQLAATEALYTLGEKESGFENLVRILESTADPVVSLEALNRTQSLGVMNDVPKDVWEKATKIGGYSQRMKQDPKDPNLQP